MICWPSNWEFCDRFPKLSVMAFELLDGSVLPFTICDDLFCIQRRDEDFLELICSFDGHPCEVVAESVVYSRRRIKFDIQYLEDEEGTPSDGESHEDCSSSSQNADDLADQESFAANFEESDENCEFSDSATGYSYSSSSIS